MKALDVAETIGYYRSTNPAICGQFEALGAVLCGLIELCQKKSTAQRRVQSGDQQSVVTARLMTGDRPARISADPVRHQPLARFPRGQIAADFAAEIDDRGKPRDSIVGFG